jgi:hypothetical protein
MKKFWMIAALFAAVSFASCGDKKEGEESEEATEESAEEATEETTEEATEEEAAPADSTATETPAAE